MAVFTLTIDYVWTFRWWGNTYVDIEGLTVKRRLGLGDMA